MKKVKLIEVWETEGDFPFRIAKRLLLRMVDDLPIYIDNNIAYKIRKEDKIVVDNLTPHKKVIKLKD
jgi:hypothetical protein